MNNSINPIVEEYQDFDSFFFEDSTPPQKEVEQEQEKSKKSTPDLKVSGVKIKNDAPQFIQDITKEYYESKEHYNSLDELEEEEEEENEEIETPENKENKEVLDSKASNDSNDSNPDEPQYSPELVVNLLRNTVDNLIEQGIWDDWDGREEVEWDEQKYAEMSEQQARWRIEDERENVLSQDAFFKTVKEYQDLGGDPEKMIELFVTQHTTQQEFDTSTDDGKVGFIIDFMVKNQGISKQKAERLVQIDVEGGELDSTYTDIKTKADALFKKQQEDLLAKQTQIQKQKEALKQQRLTSFQAELKNQKIEPKAANDLLKFTHGIVGEYEGVKYTGLEWAYYKAMQDPKLTVKLAQFLQNPDKYDEIVSTQERNKEVERTFRALGGAKSKTPVKQEAPKQDKKVAGASFSWLSGKK